MTDTAITPAGKRAPASSDEFIAELRAQGTRYHNLHPFHQRMDAGELSRAELRRWVANRFYYQKCIPLKDAAIMSNCPELEVRREWIQPRVAQSQSRTRAIFSFLAKVVTCHSFGPRRVVSCLSSV